MPNFDPPEADWTDDYAWTRHRGPKPWPCPAGWVLNEPEALTTTWRYYGGMGEGQGTDVDVFVAFDPDFDAYEAALNDSPEAWLVGSDTDDGIAWTFEIDGEGVFARVAPEPHDLMAAVAEALSKWANDNDGWQDVEPESGQMTEQQRKRALLEKRKDTNESLDSFGGGW